jgi:hypothetical protein
MVVTDACSLDFDLAKLFQSLSAAVDRLFLLKGTGFNAISLQNFTENNRVEQRRF